MNNDGVIKFLTDRYTENDLKGLREQIEVRNKLHLDNLREDVLILIEENKELCVGNCIKYKEFKNFYKLLMEESLSIIKFKDNYLGGRIGLDNFELKTLLSISKDLKKECFNNKINKELILEYNDIIEILYRNKVVNYNGD